MICTPEYSEVNPENTPCSNCSSRVHYTIFDGFIRCSFCDAIIDAMIPSRLVGEDNE